MNDQPVPALNSTPWHLWLVAALAVLWNSVGAFDYLMTETRNPSYMGSFTPQQLAYFYGLPTWVIASWAIGVWGGLLASILLLVRRRFAIPVFCLSLTGMVGTFVHNYALSDGFQILGGMKAATFSTVIVIIGVALLLYARFLKGRGVLR